MQSTDDKRINEISSVLIMAFVWSWLWWAPRILSTFEVIRISQAVDTILGIIGSFGPGLAVIYFLKRNKGNVGLLEFFKNVCKFNFDWKLLIPAILIMPVVGAITTGVLSLTDVEEPFSYSLINIFEIPLISVIVVSILTAAGEEIGWRGFLQPQLQSMLNPFRVSLLIGILWGAWQLPLHFVSGTLQSLLPILQILLQSVALCVLFTWLYNKSGGSLIITVLFHLIVNLTGMIFPVWAGTIAQWVYLLLMICSVLALGFLVGYMNFKRNQ